MPGICCEGIVGFFYEHLGSFGHICWSIIFTAYRWPNEKETESNKSKFHAF